MVNYMSIIGSANYRLTTRNLAMKISQKSVIINHISAKHKTSAVIEKWRPSTLQIT